MHRSQRILNFTPPVAAASQTTTLLSQILLLQGGFQPEMNRREAALILGLRESAAEERIKEAHRRIMIANHPDSGEQEVTCYITACPTQVIMHDNSSRAVLCKWHICYCSHGFCCCCINNPCH
jgi:hypothetical protein